MKLKWIFLCCVLMGVTQARAEESAELKTDKEKLSYSIGISIAKNFKREAVDIDVDVLVKGLKSALAGDKLLMQDKEWRKILNTYQAEMRQHAVATKNKALEDNKKKGEEFLASNKSKEGVVVLPSGVQYKIIKQGDGKKPLPSDMVQVNYRGTFIDGTEFDSTEPGHPANIKTSSVIPGWKEALGLMPVGSKWQIFIPSQLAYGERGIGSDIEPNTTLVFEVELLGIK